MIPLQFALRRRMMMANNNKVTFLYTGNCDIQDNCLKLLSSGTLIFNHSTVCDIFLVGGGGGGGLCQSKYVYGSNIDSTVVASGGGGGGGYTRTELNIQFVKNVANTVSIGAGGAPAAQGGVTSIGVISADGGYPGGGGKAASHAVTGSGGNGGSGGGVGYGYQNRSDEYIVNASRGGTDGNKGGSANSTNYVSPGTPGNGQGTTTRLFGKTDSELFSSGGHGGKKLGSVTNALDNTGNGGDGGNQSHRQGAYGGSGIAILRFPEGTTITRQ